MSKESRRKTFKIPEELAEYINVYAFRMRGRMTQSQLATKALEQFRKDNPLPDLPN
jgi:hypothetical protein